MTATLVVIGCFLAGGQAAPARGDWVMMPRLARGQELVYRGDYAEEVGGGHNRLRRDLRLELRVFVLDAPPRGADVALLTVLKHKDAKPAAGVSAFSASSVRLERGHVDLVGRLTCDAVGTLPLDGPPQLECGLFVEVPGGRIAPEQTWEVAEPGRPVQTWRNSGTDMVAGSLCLRLVGLQQSEDWDRPRADRTAWRRRDTVWLSRSGIACRVERLIERREPGRAETTQWGKLAYELDSCLQCPGPLAEDRRQEIVRAAGFRDQLQPLLAQPASSMAQLASLVKKIDYYLESQPPTPYREAVLQVRRHADAARRGEPVPTMGDARAAAGPVTATVGELTPDFVATELTGSGASRPRRWLGKPVLFVFYNPTATSAAEVLRFSQKLQNAYGPRLAVVGMSVSSDPAFVRRHHQQLGLSFPVLDGGGLRTSYEVVETPKFVLLDAANIVRGSWLGWGEETPAELVTELKRWLTPVAVLPPSPGPR